MIPAHNETTATERDYLQSICNNAPPNWNFITPIGYWRDGNSLWVAKAKTYNTNLRPNVLHVNSRIDIERKLALIIENDLLWNQFASLLGIANDNINEPSIAKSKDAIRAFEDAFDINPKLVK